MSVWSKHNIIESKIFQACEKIGNKNRNKFRNSQKHFTLFLKSGMTVYNFWTFCIIYRAVLMTSCDH
jgi:hypothetical protein